MDDSSFMPSRILMTAVELNLFTELDKKCRNAEELARDLNLNLRALTRLLDALVVYKYLIKYENTYYQNTNLGYTYSDTHPESAKPMIIFMNHMWKQWSNLTDVIRNGGDNLSPGLHMEEHEWLAFIDAMHGVGKKLSIEIAKRFDASKFNNLLDIGGCSGTYTMAFLNKYKNLKATIFDLPTVIEMAKKRLKEYQNVSFIAGDFYKDELPEKHDLILLSAIIHQNNPRSNQELYNKIFNVLTPGGTLLIRDYVLDEDRVTPPSGAIFAINMLVNQNGGDIYTFNEIESSLKTTGFINIKQDKGPNQGNMMDCLITCQKPQNRSNFQDLIDILNK